MATNWLHRTLASLRNLNSRRRRRKDNARRTGDRRRLVAETLEDRRLLAFAVATDFAVDDAPFSVTVGDFNGDGKPDLAAANLGSHNVSVLLNTYSAVSSLPFHPATDFAVGLWPYSVTVGDFNRDGKPDLATANYDSDTVSVLLNQGAGTFGAATNLAVGDRPNSVTVGDFNGDGKPDLATANYYSHTVSVLLGTGFGTFGAATNFDAGSYPNSVTVGDFNGDGKPDLATANTDSNTVSVLLGDGTGSFGAATNFAVGGWAIFVTVGDFNGDGKPDLAAANTFSNTVSVLLGDGRGSFGAATNFAVGRHPLSVTVGDFNGDGKPDLATANLDVDTVSVLLGGAPAVPAVDLSVSAASGTEAGRTQITVTATAASAVSGDQTVTLGVSGANITAGDYTLSGTTITIPNGATIGSVTFTVQDDLLNEGDETATLEISSPSAGIVLGTTTTRNITLVDDDNAGTSNYGLPAAGAYRVVLNGSTIEIHNSTPLLVASRPLGTDSLVIRGTSGNDTLTVDFSGDDPIPAGGLTFHGGDGTDGIELINVPSSFTTHTYTFNNATDGTIVLHDGSSDSTITFTGLEPISNDGDATNIIFNLPDSDNPDVVLSDTGTAVDGNMQLTGSTFEDVTMFSVSSATSITINGGNLIDNIRVAGFDNAFSGADALYLNGGAGVDTFDLEVAITGSVDGGAGVDVLQGALIDAVVLTGSDHDGFAGTEASISAGFDGIQVLTGNAGTLTGQNVMSTWGLDGTPTYSNGTHTLNFSGFATLQGDSGADTFNVTAASTFHLNGGGGNDVFDIGAALTGTVTGQGGSDTLQGTQIDAVVLTNSDANGFDGTEASLSGGFNEIETITGNGGTLTGQDATSTWDLDGTPTYTTGGNTLNFSGFATLQGGSGADTFNVTAASSFHLNGGAGNDVFDIGAALTGTVTGQGGSDTLQGTQIDAVVLTNSDANGFDGTEASLSGGFNEIETITGNGGTLTGQDATSMWDLDGTPTYSNGTHTLNFSGFATLQGGSGADTVNVKAASPFNLNGGDGNDTFALGSGGSLEGNLNGGAGSDTLDYSTYGTGVNVDLDNTANGAVPGVTGSVTSIENFLGSGSNDMLYVDALAGGVARNVDGGGGAGNVLYMNAQGQTATDNGSQITFGGGYGTITYGNFQTVHITGAALTVTGDGNANTLTVTASNSNSGWYQLDSGPIVNFSGITSLTFNGGDGNDTLILNNPAGSVFAPAGGIAYNGEGQTSTPGDTLQILGGTATTLRFDYTDLHSGSVYYNGTQVITYTGLEPITSTINATNVILNYSTTGETITVTSVSGTQTNVASTAGETTTFNNPSALLQINAGGTGDDIVNLNSISSGFNANLLIDGQGGAADRVNVNGAIDIGSGLLTIQNVETIDVNADLTADGGITFTAPTTTYLGADLQTDGTAISITAGAVVIDKTTGAVVLDTESDNSSHAGNVALGSTTISAAAADRDLTIATQGGAGANGGTVTLGTLTNTGGAYVDDLSVNADGATNGNVNLNAVVQTAGSILIDNAATVDINANVTAGTSLTIQNVTTEIDLAANVDLTANGGNLDLNNSVAQIDLSGSSGTNVLSGSAAVLLAAVVDSGAAGPTQLTVQSGTDMTLAAITLNGSNNPVLDLDVDTGADGSQTLSANGALLAAVIQVTGQGTSETLNFASTVTATSGAVTIANAATVDLNGTVTAATSLEITNATVVDLAGGVNLTAQNGLLDVQTGVGGILLSGATGTANVIDGNGDATLRLGAVTASNSPNLTVNSQGDVNLTSANIGASGDLTVNVDDNANGSHTGTFGALTAGTINVAGSGDNDTLTFNGNVSSNEAAGVTVAAGTINFNAPVSTTAGSGIVSIIGQNAVNFNVGSGVTAGGTIAILANQDGSGVEGFTQALGTTIQTTNTGTGAIAITVNTAGGGTGSAAIASLQTGLGGRATIQAHGGAITDNNGELTNITAGETVLSAALGIGSANALETDVDTLAASNTTSGNIQIRNDDANNSVPPNGLLIIGTVGGVLGVSNADPLFDGGNIVITNSSPVTVSSPVSDSAGGDITIAAEGSAATDDLTVNADVTASGGNGAIYLYAGDSISLSGAVAVDAAGAGLVLLSAGSDYNSGSPIDGSPTGNVTMANGSVVSSEDGDISLLAPNDVFLVLVNTDSNNDNVRGTATIVADYEGPVAAPALGNLYASNGVGAIHDSRPGETLNLRSGLTVLRAATGIGSGGGDADIDANSISLVAVNSTSGDIAVNEVATGGRLDVEQAIQNGSGSIRLTTENGSLRLLVGGAGAQVNNASGTVLLDANVLNAAVDEPLRGDVVLNAAVITGGGGITIHADHDVLGTVAATISSSGGGIAITADANDAGPAGDRGTIQLAGNITAGAGTVTFSLADCDGWVGATPGSASGNVTAANIVMGNDAKPTDSGVLRLQGGANTFSGNTTVVEGILLVNGMLTDTAPGTPSGGDVLVQAGGVLGGHGVGTTTGVINGSITVLSGGILDPGDYTNCTPQTGRLTVNLPGGAFVDLQAGGTFRVQLAGLLAGATSGGYDQLVLNGTANINLHGNLINGAGGGTLLVQPQFDVPVGAEFRIVDNDLTDLISTRFENLPEGAFLDSVGVLMNISYLSGSNNNDITLTAPGRYDFDGYYGHTAANYMPISPFTAKTGANSAGWQALPPRYFERTWPVQPPYTSDAERLKYDGHSTDRNGNPLTFEVTAVAGKQYEVMILTGDVTWNHDRMRFDVYDANGTLPPTTPVLPYSQTIDSWSSGAPDGSNVLVTWGGGDANTSGTGYYRWIRFTTDSIVNAGAGLGTLLMRMQDLGGWDPTAVILAMDIRPVEAVGEITIERTAPAGTAAGAPLSFTSLAADGMTVDTYAGTGAPPHATLTVTVSAGTVVQYAEASPDGDVTMFGTQITANQFGHFSFSVLRPATLTNTPAVEENWTIQVEEVSGLSRGTVLQPYAAPEQSAPLRFDFGISGSPVQAGFLPVIPQTTYNPTRGYGWTSRVAGANRRDTSMSELRRDLNYASDATFRVDLPDGNGVYSVRIYHANPLYFGVEPRIADNFRVYAEGVEQYAVADIPAGTTEIQTFTVTVSDGVLDLRFQDFGGWDRNFVVSGIEISAGTLPGVAPLLAAGNPLDSGAASITTADLAPVMAEATARWLATGLTPEQTAALETVRYRVADLGGAYLGLADVATNSIRIDDDAARLGWALVGGRRSEIGGRRSVDDGPGTGDQGRMTDDGVDLLTVVMHELGHLLGYDHSDDEGDLMAPVLRPSQARTAADLDSHALGLSLNLSPNLLQDSSPQRSPLARSVRPMSGVHSEATEPRGQTPSRWDATDLFADLTLNSGEETGQTRMSRRSRMERYERELDLWFTELGEDS